jgi:uncharacterized protein YxeA
MKQLLSVILLVTITVTAYADKNNKAATATKDPAKPVPKQEQTVKPANNPASNDTAWHGTGKENPYGFREYDTRTRRYMPVDPTTRPSPFGNNPYQNTTNNPIKAEDIK